MAEFIDVNSSIKNEYNSVVGHPLQSFEWGEFRKRTGVKVIRRGFVKNGKIIDGFTLTLHKIPKTKFYIGYLPKGNKPDAEILNELRRIGRMNNCIFIQLEPNVKAGSQFTVLRSHLRTAARPLFTKYTFVLDLSKSEDDLLAAMHPKTRYNIKVAEKHKVTIKEDNSEKSFKEYLNLMQETTSRQGFYAHTSSYHKSLWETLADKTLHDKNSLTYHLINAYYKSPETKKELVLTSWVLFVFKDTLYYPYGASSRHHRETMASNLIAWDAIKLGKKMGLKYFDMWGALSGNPDKSDPWYGFHRFKEGYGGELVEFVGSYDLVIKPAVYEVYKVADKIRWGMLGIKKRWLR